MAVLLTCSIIYDLSAEQSLYSVLNKYSRDRRDGIQPRNVKAVNNKNKTLESLEEQQKHKPVNLTNQIVEQPLVELCSRGPSFVPTPTSIDWNSLQQSWQAFKRKV